MEKKYKKQYSSSYQSLEAIWNVLRLYSSQEHPLTVGDIHNHLKKTEDAPPSPRRLERLLTQGDGLMNTLFPTLEVCWEKPPSYSTVDNRLKEILTYGGETPHELRCVAHKRRWNGEVRSIPYRDIEAYSTDEEDQKNNVARRYYLKGPLTDGAWRFLSDFVRDYPCITHIQTEQLLTGLDLLVQPKRSHIPERRSSKPARSEMLLIVEQVSQAIQERKKLLITVGDYALERSGGRLTPVLRPGEEVELAPYALVWSGGHYWLVGREQELVTLRLDRLLRARQLEKSFALPEDFDPAAYRTGLPLAAAGRRAVVRLRCPPELLGDVADLLGQGAEYSALQPDGTFEVTAPTVPELVKSLALRWPDKVEILEPESLRQDIFRILQKGMTRYAP